MRGLADGVATLESSCGSLGLHVHHDFGFLKADKVSSFLVVEDFAPGFFEAHQFGALAARHFRHAIAEETVGERHHLHPRQNKVGDGSFHATAASGGDDEGQLVLGSEHRAKKPLNVGGDLEEIGIEMADDGLSHCLVNPGMDLTWSGAKQQPLGRMNRDFFG